MADTKITALTAITTVDPAVDVLPIVDVSDTSMAASGTTKKITSNQILGAGGTATLASATITGDLTVDTSTLKVDSTNNRVGIGTATPGNKLNVAGNSSANVEPDFQINRSSSGTTIQSGPNITFVDGTTNNTTTLQVTQGRFGVWNYGSGSWNERLSVDSSGNVGIGVTPSAGKGCLQLSSGINFPATQVASSDANTLDDYEEGTFSPTITAGSGTPTTVTVNSATYTKVGRIVTAQVDFTIVNKGTATTSLLFTLPFTSASLNQCGAFRETSNTGNMGQIYSSGTTQAGMQFYGNTTVWADANRVAGTYTYTV